jgi:transposase
MAEAVGNTLRSVQRIWQAHQLQPHRIRTFKPSRDPSFAAKLVDVVGLYVDPPAHAVVLSLDEKSQIQALDRTQPGLPIKPGVARRARSPRRQAIHAVLDNYATHKHPKVLAWLSRHPRWIFHFTPTSASWLNAVENFFSKMTRQRIRRGVFRSIVDLQSAIKTFLGEHNAHPKPFVWTQSANAILAKLDRVPVLSECV